MRRCGPLRLVGGVEEGVLHFLVVAGRGRGLPYALADVDERLVVNGQHAVGELCQLTDCLKSDAHDIIFLSPAPKGLHQKQTKSGEKQ